MHALIKVTVMQNHGNVAFKLEFRVQ